MPPAGKTLAAMPAAVFLLALLGLVHVCPPAGEAWAQRAERKRAPASQSAAGNPLIAYATEALPAPVLDMREAILAAVRSGRIEDLRVAVELNEMKPVIADGPVGDPIAHWRQVSADGEGRDILAALGLILEAGYVTLPLGRDLENNKVYVWPYFVAVAPDTWTPAQEAELLRIVPASSIEEMKRAGAYNFYKLGIAADGTWHFFLR
jgi:hypothetical protein